MDAERYSVLESPYFTVQILDKVRSRTKELRNAWKQAQNAWKPVSLIFFTVSAIKSITEFKHRSGPYFLGGIGFSALALAILFTVPIESVRLFARRLFAFIIDFLLFGLATTGGVSLLFDGRILRPSAITSMALVWSWVFLFVLFDWRFKGTPGKLVLRLRLSSKRTRNVSLLSCLARNLLMLVVPLTVAGSVLSVVTHSKLGACAQWSIAVALLLFFPLSVKEALLTHPIRR